MDKLHIEITTPDGMIFAGDALSATLPGVEGEFGVLPGHASLLSLLNAGIIEIQTIDNKLESVAIDSGYAEVSPSKIDVLAEGAVAISGNNESQIAKSIAKAKELLEGAHTNITIASLEAKIELAGKSKI